MNDANNVGSGGSGGEQPEASGLDARLAAADPARGADDGDLASIRARVLATDDTAPVVPLRRRTVLIAVASVAAGVLLLAGAVLGGVAVGRSTAPVAEVATPVVPDETLAVVGASPPLASSGSGAAPAPGVASVPAGAATSETAADKAMIYPGWGVTLLPAPDLPNTSGTAPGYRLVGDGVDREALASLVAATFGVDGSPTEQEYGGWSVGRDDGPTVWVGDDAMVSWSYWNPEISTWDCAVIEPMPVDDAGTTEPAAPEECLPTTPPPSTRDAVRQAKAYLASLGVSDDPAFATGIEWESGTDDWSTYVTAWQLVDGQRTQLSWSFSFTGEGLSSSNGFAAGLEQIPAYPIVGARTAVLRSADPKYAALGPTFLDGNMVYPMAEARDVTGAEDSGAATSSAPPAGDPAKVQVSWDPALATGAELTLVQYWQPDGTLLILPAYAISTADDRGTWGLIAVADSALDFITPTPAG